MKSDDELFDEFIGPEHSPQRKDAVQTIRDWPERTPMAAVLFSMQERYELGGYEQGEVVYKEEDIRRLVEFLGYPVNFGNE